MSNTFTAHAHRNEGWWSIRVEEDPGIITQTRRLDQIPDMVRDALILFPELTDDPENATINVIVEPESTIATEAAQATRDARKAQEKATALMRKAAKELSTQGLPYRDIGTLLGVSFQRAQKLATS